MSTSPRLWLVLSLAVAGAAGCVDDVTVSSTGDAPTFEEFKADTDRTSDGAFIVDGDIVLRDDDALRAFYEEVYSGQALTINTVNGADDRWTSEQAMNLTYCVSNQFSNKAAVVDGMRLASKAWEERARVKFTYRPDQDSFCSVINSNVVFAVESTFQANLYAAAFFPSYQWWERKVQINESMLLNGDFPAWRILGHELGHILGFRHEHIRPESGVCFENTSWRPLTPYDRGSIMHYPWCNGESGDLALQFSAYDAQGAQSIYGAP